mmetsp:Transcript_866/g.2973  ORF Transcript_866/g.2973 Transcript_866/m.2973 type:complete len:206 (-) Transcript_866:299-916(-)
MASSSFSPKPRPAPQLTVASCAIAPPPAAADVAAGGAAAGNGTAAGAPAGGSTSNGEVPTHVPRLTHSRSQETGTTGVRSSAARLHLSPPHSPAATRCVEERLNFSWTFAPNSETRRAVSSRPADSASKPVSDILSSRKPGSGSRASRGLRRGCSETESTRRCCRDCSSQSQLAARVRCAALSSGRAATACAASSAYSAPWSATA